MRATVLTVFSAVAALTGAARAADVMEAAVPVPEAVEVRDIILDLGIGAVLDPRFPSAKEYTVEPWPIVSLQFLRLPVIGEVVTGKPRVFSIYPSFNFVGERNEDDASYLDGTDDVDFSFELGPGFAVQYGWVRAFAEVRYGIVGHNGIVVDTGIDLTTSPLDKLTVSAGPRLSLADDAYMDAYFGVPAGAVLPEYDPAGGLKDVGAAIEASYAVTENLRIRGKASWTHYIADAEDSPIVKSGEGDEFMVGIGLSYRFGLDLY